MLKRYRKTSRQLKPEVVRYMESCLFAASEALELDSARSLVDVLKKNQAIEEATVTVTGGGKIFKRELCE